MGLRFKINLTILSTLAITMVVYSIILLPFENRRRTNVIDQIKQNFRTPEVSLWKPWPASFRRGKYNPIA
jgi:hypothetical protein